MSDRSAGEQEFINQKTRELMVGWCHEAIGNGGRVTLPVASEFEVYLAFAKEKKWVNAEGRILSAGWDTAARYLKR